MLQRILASIMSTFLAFGCSPTNDKDLVNASGVGDLSRVTALLKNGANIEAYAMDGWTPLTAAAAGGHIAVIQELILAGANIDGVEAGGNTPLLWATFNNHRDVVELLLSHGANKKISNKSASGKQKLPIDVARERGYFDIVYILSSP